MNNCLSYRKARESKVEQLILAELLQYLISSYLNIHIPIRSGDLKFPMKDEDLYFFKQLLNEQLEALLGQADIAVHTLLESGYETSPDPVDRASFESERGTMFRIKDRESKLIRKIQKSLENLENGSFGICEMCEKEIAIERLKARPVTTHCIKCKKKMEALER